MMKKKLKPVKPIKIRSGMTVDQLISQFNAAGVMGHGALARAVDVLEQMIKDVDCHVLMGQAGALVPAGMRHIIAHTISKRWIDVFVTTGATLTHDLAEGLGYPHLQGSANVDDRVLRRRGLDRIYDAYMGGVVYERMEEFVEKALDKIASQPKNRKVLSTSEFLNLFGKLSPKGTILRACFEKKVPVFCPALADSGLGLQVWSHMKKNEIGISAFEDLEILSDMTWSAKRTGVFYIGGGVPKNFIQQALQFTKEAYYAVQVTADRPELGGSSGAPLREGISWGKLGPKASAVSVYADATIAFPIIVAALSERLG